MVAVSAHATERAYRRLDAPPERALELFVLLWLIGRKATDEDFVRFSTWRRSGVDYKVSVFKHRLFLVAMGKEVYITLFKPYS